METKGKVRSFSDIFGEDVSSDPKQAGITEIELPKLIPFANHHFQLYTGERLNDMVSSIKDLGVISPIITRPKDEDCYEILSGHNRVIAARIAGLERVPAVIKEGLSDEEANLIVTETNLIQRSFADLSHSERAIAIAAHHKAIKKQGKRNDLISEIESLIGPHSLKDGKTSSQLGTKSRADEKVGERYNLSRNTVARYIRLNELIPELLARVDKDEIAFMPAVTLSFVKKSEQYDIERILRPNNFRIGMAKAAILRSDSEAGLLTEGRIYEILLGKSRGGQRSAQLIAIKVKPKVIAKFFKEGEKAEEVEEVIEKALELYFSTLPDKCLTK